MGDITQINNLIDENSTVLNQDILNNSEIKSDSTSINNAIINDVNATTGTILCDSYVIQNKLNTSTGEANLFLCKKNGISYVAKIYKRKIAIKSDITDKLLNLDSPYIAKLYATGSYNGYPVEILPYYKNGSLQGHKYTFEELKNHIIPSLNEGIKILHDKGIVHKDLKPSNIMLHDNGRDISIIDFGISSVRDNDNTVIITNTGMTPDYSAPETFRNLVLNESDYYSMGITIYELFCGFTPYANLSSEEIEQYLSIQKIPFPDDMPLELKNLIAGLTYIDLTNRKNKNNPNRRWGYEEVINWCNGIEQIVPGESLNNKTYYNIPSYKFLGKEYNDKHELVNAIAVNWEDGKKQLFRGLLSSFYKTIDPELAGYCLDAEEEVSKSYNKEDIIFFKTLYKLDKDTTKIYWKGRAYNNLKELGHDLLQRLWSDDKSIDEYFGSILREEMLSCYANSIGTKDILILNTFKNLESTYRLLNNSEQNRLQNYYLMAYLLSEEKILKIHDNEFSKIDDLSNHLYSLLHSSYDEFEAFCKTLVNERGDLNPQFESWLIALDKKKEIDKWRSGLQ